MSLTPQTRREREVWEACDDLLAKGLPLHQLTFDLIVNRLLELGYKKGNPKQVYDYRKTWREARGLDGSSGELRATSTLSDPIQRVVVMVREELQAEAAQRITELQAEADDKIRHALQQSEASLQQLQEVLQRFETKEKENQELKRVNSELQDDLAQSRQAERISEARATSLQTSLVQLREQTEEIKQFHQNMLKLLKEQFEQRHQDSQVQIDQLKTFAEQQRHHYIAEIDQLKTTIQKQEKELVKANTAEELIQARYQELKQEYHQQQIALEQVAQLKEQLLVQIAEKNKTVEIITAEIMQYQTQLKDRENKIKALQESSLVCQKRIGQLETECSHAAQTIKALKELSQEEITATNKETT